MPLRTRGIAAVRVLSALIGLLLTLVGAGAVMVLVRIGGQSDGPGALLFYLAAAIGLGGGLPLVLGSVFHGATGSDLPAVLRDFAGVLAGRADRRLLVIAGLLCGLALLALALVAVLSRTAAG